MSALQPIPWVTSRGTVNAAAARTAAAAFRPTTIPLFRSRGQAVLLSVIGAVTWLAVVGAFFASYILAVPIASHHSAITFAAFNLNEAAPTGFGSLSVTRAELASDAEAVHVRVEVNVVNSLDGTVEAPRV